MRAATSSSGRKTRGIGDQSLQGRSQIALGHDATLCELIHHPKHAVDLDAGIAGATAELLVACQEDPILPGLGQHKAETVIGRQAGMAPAHVERRRHFVTGEVDDLKPPSLEAGDGRGAALPDPGSWRDAAPTARRGRRG
jgi:hypothetical protein